MYYFFEMAAGSPEGHNIRLEENHPAFFEVQTDTECWCDSADVFVIYGLIKDCPDNRKLDEMICEELDIETSDFSESEIHILEVAANIWSSKSPEVYLYYGGEEVKKAGLREKIASALMDGKIRYTDDFEIEYGTGDAWMSNVLSYAMGLIIAENGAK